ncbi:MAG: hypothetical protein PHQ52_03610 [Candidatus Omnitrophica bacterium]|nr:hypothetical protein [Candidatus Omnitrophota bacterium]
MGIYIWNLMGLHCSDNNRGGSYGPACRETPKGAIAGSTSMTYTLSAAQSELARPS